MKLGSTYLRHENEENNEYTGIFYLLSHVLLNGLFLIPK